MVLQAMRSDPGTRLRFGLVVLAVVVYLAMWIGWTSSWSWVTEPDAVALDAAHRVAVEHHGWVVGWNVLCSVFSPLTFRVVTLALIVRALFRRRNTSPGRSAPARRPRVALFLFLSVELSAVVTEIAKYLADRPRPATALVHALGTSFPSGHALGSMVAVLALWVVYGPRLRRDLWPWAVAAAVLIVVLVGVGRVALNVHHPSDIVAGWALGYVYFVACLPALRRRDPVIEPGGTPAVPGSAR
jgi:membrane-associated phospholipid phosphatase